MRVTDMLGWSLEERLAHIDLSEPCTPCGYHSKQHILKALDLEDDIGNWRDAGVHRCHVCNHNSKNGWCSNPRHMFIGNVRDNMIPQRDLLVMIGCHWYESLEEKKRFDERQRHLDTIAARLEAIELQLKAQN